MHEKNQLLNLLKVIRCNLYDENINIKIINNEPIEKELIRKAILFDNGNTCFNGYDKIDDMVNYLCNCAINFGIFYKEEFIGLSSVTYKHIKDPSRLVLSLNLDKNYQNSKIGTYCMQKIMDYCFSNYNYKCFHIAVREDNIPSLKMVNNLGFKEYIGYKDDDYFILNNEKIPQKQFILKKKEYKKKQII